MNRASGVLNFISFRDSGLERRLRDENPILLVFIRGFRIGVFIGIFAVLIVLLRNKGF